MWTLQFLMFLLLAAATTNAYDLRHRRLQPCDCTCTYDDVLQGLAVILLEEDDIAEHNGNVKVCLPNDEALDYLEDESAKCDDSCNEEESATDGGGNPLVAGLSGVGFGPVGGGGGGGNSENEQARNDITSQLLDEFKPIGPGARKTMEEVDELDF